MRFLRQIFTTPSPGVSIQTPWVWMPAKALGDINACPKNIIKRETYLAARAAIRSEIETILMLTCSEMIIDVTLNRWTLVPIHKFAV